MTDQSLQLVKEIAARLTIVSANGRINFTLKEKEIRDGKVFSKGSMSEANADEVATNETFTEEERRRVFRSYVSLED